MVTPQEAQPGCEISEAEIADAVAYARHLLADYPWCCLQTSDTLNLVPHHALAALADRLDALTRDYAGACEAITGLEDNVRSYRAERDALQTRLDAMARAHESTSPDTGRTA